MAYILLFIIGIATDRYLLPLLDLMLDLLNHKLSSVAQIDSINTKREVLKFQREMDEYGAEPEPRIGFQYEKVDCEEDEDDEEEMRKR